MSTQPHTQPYGLLARFASVSGIYNAAKTVRDAGYRNWDVFTPFPIHGMDAAMGIKRSRVPVFTFLGGLTGFCSAIGIVYYMGLVDYPLIVNAKPFFGFVFPFPIYYELTILLAAFGTLIGMFLLNRLPMHHHPLFNTPEFRRLTDDQFALLIETRDPKFDLEQARALLTQAGAYELVEVSADDACEDILPPDAAGTANDPGGERA